MPYKRVIMLLADGARPDVLEELLAEGRLPAIARAFPSSDMRRTAISVFPSTTGPAFLPFLTGHFPGPANMPGIRWFDRAAYAERDGRPYHRSYVGVESYRMNSDLSPHVKTLWETIPNSATMYSSVNRGVPRSGNYTKISRAWWWGYAHTNDRWDIVNRRVRKRLLASLDGNHDFTFCLIPDVDNFSHLSHARSDDVYRAYDRLDGIVGDLFAELDTRGQRDETLVMIVSDHGHSAVHTHLGLPEWVRDQGYDPFYYPRMWKRRFDSVVSVSGNGMSHINVRGGERWSSEPTWDEALRESHSVLLDGLLSRPEIAIMATQRSDGTVVVRSHDGEAHVRRTEVGRVDYRSVSATDPLGYDDMSGVWDADDLLAATFDTKYPDGPVQLLQTFDSPRTGDIVVSAEVGYDLRDKHESPEHKGGHGALHGDHMRVPWLSTAPLPDTPLRTVDVFGYTLQQMGMPVPEHIDGRVLTADGNVESRETRASVAAC